MKKILATLGFLLWWGAATHAQNNPCIASTVTNCTTAAGNPFTLATATNGSWPMACFGEPVALTATPSTGLAGLLEYTSTYEDCSVVTSITALAASNIISSWWTATNAGFSASGTNLAALFTPTNCGVGTVTFTMTYSNTSPCGQPVSSAVVFSNALSSGNQSGFDLGMDFVVNSNVTVTALGTFDPNIASYTPPITQAQITNSLGPDYYSSGDPFSIYVAIFDVSTGETVGPTIIFNYGNSLAGTYYAAGGSIYQEVTPFVLTNGTYSIVASGYTYLFESGNTILGSPSPLFDTLGGALTLCPGGVTGGTGARFNSSSTFVLPTGSTGNAESGGSPIFLAGTFIASSGAISNTTVTLTTNFTVVNVVTLAPTNASACGATLLSSNVTAQSFLVPVATTGPTNLAILATSCPTLPASQLPSCWSLNGYQTNLALVNLTAAHISTNICSVGISSLTNIIYVEAPPVIVTQPTNQTVFQGSNATFTVAATGTTNLLYQWRLGGTNITGATNTSLLLTNVLPAEGGYYSVLVSNLVGSAVSSNALLTVTSNRPPVVILLNPTNGEVFAFSPNNILVSAWAYQTNGSISYVDFYNGTNLLGMTSSASSNIYSFLWTNVSSGYYALSAVALSSNGLSATNAVTFTNYAVPAVSITTPTNFQTFLEVTNVLLSATASELSGTISNVVFYNLTNLIGIATQSGTNYTFLWTNLSAGIYPITAVATDNRGASTRSSNVVFKVNSTNLAPGIAISYPTNGTSLPACSTYTILAQTTNGSGNITNVEFFVNGIMVGNSTNRPYSIDQIDCQQGTYIFTAVAMDDQGGIAVSASVTNTIAQAVAASGGGFWDPNFANSGIYVPGDETAIFAVSSSNTNLYVIDIADDLISNNEFGTFSLWNNVNWINYSDPDSLTDNYFYSGNAALAIGVNGTNLYVGGSGEFNPVAPDSPSFLQRWNGSFWDNIGDGLVGQIHVIAIFGSNIYVGGTFISTESGDTNIQYIAMLTGSNTNWMSVASSNLNGPVLAIAMLDNHLYIGGDFTNASGNSNANYIAELQGDVWTNLGSGLSRNLIDGNDGYVKSIAVSQNKLFVGGNFTAAGGNTNANGIAIWNLTNWSTIGKGVAGSPIDYNFDALVNSVVLQCNNVYVGGYFTNAINDSGPVSASCIAEAVWDADSETYTWVALDKGLSNQYGGSIVFSMAIVPGKDSGTFDLYAGGLFSFAGSSLLYAPNIAKWSVGTPYPTNFASVVIVQPSQSQVIYSTNTVDLQATVLFGTNSISSVQFFIDNTSVGFGTPGSFGNYELAWPPTSGSHYLTAQVVDSAGFAKSSSPRFFTVDLVTNFTTTNIIVANSDVFTIAANSPPNYLPVLTNDLSGSPMALSDAEFSLGTFFGGAVLGSIAISYDRQSIVYTPLPNYYGTNYLYYTVTNTAGASAQGFVTVNIVTHPQVQISYPADGTVTNVSSSVIVAGKALDYSASVTNVFLYLNGSLFYQTNGPNFSFAFSTNVADYYTFVAVAMDAYGSTNSSLPVTIDFNTTASSSSGDPVSIIISPTNTESLAGTTPATVSSGQLSVTGSAYDPHGNPVSYQILLLDPANPGNPPLYNVTPGVLDSQGFHVGAVTNGLLGSLDLSSVQNGVYTLELLVRAGGNEAYSLVNVALTSNLKIGQFSFSEQDLILPVSGIPITITRTYNSLNPLSSDFGYSWSFAINSMDVQLDEQRQDIPLEGDTLNTAQNEVDINGVVSPVSVRSGGGRDVTLTLPDGRRVTYAFNPIVSGNNMNAHARWTAPPGVAAQLSILNVTGNSDIIQLVPQLPPYWQDGGDDSTLDNCDVPGWVLTTADGTQYNITRGAANYVTYEDPANSGSFLTALAYGTPTLTSIVQPSGSTIVINPNSIYHKDNNATNRTVNFSRDGQGRITAIYDPNNGTNGSPLVQYIYNQTTGNLLQVIKLVDASTGTYTTNQYDYNNPNFPHYITSIENANGVPVARNFYDDSGRLTAVEDADGNLTQFTHNLTNNMEVVVDRRGNTNTFIYDLNGNVIAQTNALGQVTTMAYDGNNNKTNQITFLNGTPYATNSSTFDNNNNLLSSTDALGRTSTFAYNSLSEVTNSIDARNFGTTNYYDAYGDLTSTVDALGNVTLNVYANGGLLLSSTDALGDLTTNYYDASENLVATAVLDPTGTIIMSTNSFAYDLNGNRTNSVVYRHTAGSSGWVAATTSYFYDAQNRLVQTIDANGGTNTTVYNAVGKQSATIDALGHTNSFVYDDQNRLIQTVYPDGTSESSAYDSSGNRTNSVDRLSRTNVYVYDALNRLTQTIFADNSTNTTVYDGVGRVQYSIDARGMSNAFGYDVAGQQVAVTNGFGTSISNVMWYAYDANGNRTVTTDIMGRSMTSVYDPLNRVVTNLFADGTFTVTVYDVLGRKSSQTDQATNTTWFGYDSLGRLICVTNALQQVTRYGYDEAGNQTNQMDALNRQTTYEYDALGRRIKRTLPGGQSETMAYDALGNLQGHTDFNGLVITNQYDCLNRLTNRWQGATSLESYAYDAAGELTNRVDTSGAYSWVYDLRGRMTTNVTPVGTLFYAYDTGGNLTNLHSATTGGVNIAYQYDALARLTNVIDNGLTGTKNTAYTYDLVGNLQTLQYPNDVTNLWQYDPLNRLTNEVVKLTSTALASFYYKLGANGNRTNLSESVNGTSRAYAWSYDQLYRLTNETISGASSGTIAYGFDVVGNRTNRSSSLSGISAQTPTYGSNDWLSTDSYDSNGNTTVSSSVTYQYDYANRLTNNGSMVIVYGADGNRISKTVGSTTTLYLVATVNPTGYPQVVEESTVSSGVTNLGKVYTHGLSLISQRQSSTVYFFGLDGHGSTRLLTDGSGTVANVFAYDAYGNLIASNTTPQTAYLYGGEQWDLNLGQYYNRARYYQPNTGRFWTMDTLEAMREEPADINKYLYCRGNPVDGQDPSGHDDVMDSTGFSFSTGAGSSLFGAFAPEQASASDSSKEQLPDPNDPALDANYNSVFIKNSKRNVDDLFEELKQLDVNVSVVIPTAGIPITGVGSRIEWTPAPGTLMYLGQKPFFVTVNKYSDNNSRDGEGDHFFSAVTMGGHPLEGWRFWRVYRVSGGMVVETGAVDKPAGLKPRIGNMFFGARTSALQTWTGLMNNSLAYSRGTQGGGAFDNIQGKYDNDKKQSFLKLVQ